MCGIIGYTGQNEAKEMLLDALELLEYRGYDSAGLALGHAVCGQETAGDAASLPKPVIVKCAGRVKKLRKQCEKQGVSGTCGIGHTRWATHGNVTNENAHPHRFGQVTVIHNGIIENYQELIRGYHLEGQLVSQTDSEVAAAVLDHFYKEDCLSAIRRAVLKLKGTFALAILFDDEPDTIYTVRNVSPVVIAKTESGSMLASDLTVIGQYTKDYFVLPEFHIAVLKRDEVLLYDMAGDEISYEWQTIDWDVDKSGKDGYPFYMEKEIMEQPEAIRQTILSRIENGLPDFSKEGIPDSLFQDCDKVCIVACGTAMHAGLIGKVLFQTIVKIPTQVELASEFMYSDTILDEKTLVIAISQSGETIDTLEALKYAKKQGAKALSVVNVRESSIARESQHVLYTCAGPEIAVASTKAYTTQLAALYLVTAKMAEVRKMLEKEGVKAFLAELLRVPDVMEKVLEQKEQIHYIARSILNAQNVFMIGRGMDHYILLEGSLKLKEISYIHSEAYASGELKHGTIALITEDTPVVAVVTQEKLVSKELSNIREVQSRGAEVICFIREGIKLSDGDSREKVFLLPELRDEFMVLPASAALQLLAYYVSLDKGLDVDKPRNLAKVVTVE